MRIELTSSATILSCICPLCYKNGSIRMLELLPKGGILMECIHSDNSVHKWSEFNSMDAVMRKNENKIRNPIIIVCPVCNKRGRINDYHPDRTNPRHVEYLVTHEKLKGTWGKKSKIGRRRRCYVTKQSHREIVLKKLGRHIPPTNSLERYIEK